MLTKFDAKSLSVGMNRRGASAAFTITTGEGVDSFMNVYSFLVGSRLVKVIKNGIDIIDENDVDDPLHPTHAEAALINMSKELNGFDEHLYQLACGLAVLFNNDASNDYAEQWLSQYIEEILRGED
ncbi:hypothetical protein Hena1_02330 [Erwinia phage Hena1]|uniref:Uncharacterized protein n=1 Tax=Erwinia phage Hena1 TaxID=2678601 RepID=A0A6B9J9Y8_9CAUD|nr:hypothetical protein HWC84_gp131 [Erwinia phage Hena1]QGZ16383.1 hypothetical protein Hena1_02330 [Erwinia phage Hena1]